MSFKFYNFCSTNIFPIDLSGWAWHIPLHNGTMSAGVVMRQDLQVQRKRASNASSPVEFYKECLQLAPSGWEFLSKGEIVSDVKHASDWSYSASAYSSPYVRIAGDAGCFIDPYFSSGVHLAYASGLSAAMTICASIRGDCNELQAANWHSTKVAEGYTRFLLVVMSATKQIRGGDEAILSDLDEDGFDVAFDAFRPSRFFFWLRTRFRRFTDNSAVIQGTADADVGGKLTHEEVVKAVDFGLNAFDETLPEERKKVLEKVAAVNGIKSAIPNAKADLEKLTEKLTEDEMRILNHLRARQMLRFEDTANLNHFGSDAIDGFTPNLKRGSLTLVAQGKDTSSTSEAPVLDLLVPVDEHVTEAEHKAMSADAEFKPVLVAA